MILKTPPKKLYHGKKRYCNYFEKKYGNFFKWALTVKPGDWIGTCLGYNEQVKNIEYDWQNEGEFRRSRKNNYWFLHEITFFNFVGGMHTCPGGSCVFPPETNQQILSYWKSFVPENLLPKLNQFGGLDLSENERNIWHKEVEPYIWREKKI